MFTIFVLCIIPLSTLASYCYSISDEKTQQYLECKVRASGCPAARSNNNTLMCAVFKPVGEPNPLCRCVSKEVLKAPNNDKIVNCEYHGSYPNATCYGNCYNEGYGCHEFAVNNGNILCNCVQLTAYGNKRRW